MVVSDTQFLASLDARQIRTGLAEVIKYGLIQDRALYEFLTTQHNRLMSYDQAAFEYVITRSSRIKSRIVEIDEREEKGKRTILNFGHTLGHALEAAGGFQLYTHGEAVGLGMLVALDIGRRLGITRAGLAGEAEALLDKYAFPVRIRRLSLQRIMQACLHDKKFKGGRSRLVLLKDIARPLIVDSVALGLIKDSVRMRLA
jgi:3-dehydroquinate synthase